MTSTAPYDIGALIEARDGVCGGRPCLAGTRFPVAQLAVLYNEGLSVEAILIEHPDLGLAAIHAGLAYYLANSAAVDAELAAEERDYARALRLSRRRPGPTAD